MRCLIAISTCWDFEKNGNNDALRTTWLPDVKRFPGLDYRFFVGRGQGAEELECTGDLLPVGGLLTAAPDVVFLPYAEDDYGHLTYKTQESLKYACGHGYDFVFRCFPDTYVCVERLMTCGFENSDYHGDFRGEKTIWPNYASGGCGYSLSRRCCEMLIRAPILGVWRDTHTPYVEDLWVGRILRDDITRADDPRFVNHGQRYWPDKSNTAIASHLSCGPNRYAKEMMFEAHQHWRTH